MADISKSSICTKYSDPEEQGPVYYLACSDQFYRAANEWLILYNVFVFLGWTGQPIQNATPC